jgi:protein-tyrosine phosphatase
LSSPETGEPQRLGLFHRAFDRLYPAIRFTYERLMGHVWFTQVTPVLWLGGAPTYGRDFEALIDLRITAVVDMRAERAAEPAFFLEHEIAHRQYFVPDITVPGEEVLTDSVAWITDRVAEGRTVLIHCAKGRGRSATVLAAYLMKTEGMSFDEVEALMTSKRKLVKLQDRHRVVLESWMSNQRAG